MSQPTLPSWSSELITLYESHAANQFILYGNVNDRFILPIGSAVSLGSLNEFWLKVILPKFDVILSYDIGNGIRLEKGGEIFSQWPGFKEHPELPKSPRQAIEVLTRYFRYCANLVRLGKQNIQVGCFIQAAHLLAPAVPGGISYDLSALAMQIRDWACDELLAGYSLATFLITENLTDLHPLLVNNTRSAAIKIPLPSAKDIGFSLAIFERKYPVALKHFKGKHDVIASQLAGTTLNAVENLLKVKEYKKETLVPTDLVQLRKQLVEKDCNDLIEFIESNRSLDDLHAQQKLKEWLRQDLALWKQNDIAALPMGYLLCGPVGTGKTYLVECLAGEAGIPVVKIKNFRDRWVGSTEGNLEKIFRLLQSLGRCFVFIDEADQALGKRESGGSDGGLSGRIYSMFAKEMSNPMNRGRIIWILASSRPDLIEVDLKRPGRIDVKIPIFPTTSPEEGFELISALCRRRGIELPPSDLPQVRSVIPELLTPGAAEALAVKVYRTAQLTKAGPLEALKASLADYQNPVSKEIMDFQIRLAIQESTDIEFVPQVFRKVATVEKGRLDTEGE